MRRGSEVRRALSGGRGERDRISGDGHQTCSLFTPAQFFAWGQEAQPPLERERTMSQTANTSNAIIATTSTKSQTFTATLFSHAMPSAMPMRRTASAASHAIANMPTATRKAQPAPSSRLMAAMAATHGV